MSQLLHQAGLEFATPNLMAKKTEVARINGYRILQSDSEDSLRSIVHFSVISPEQRLEILTADSFKDGRFDLSWSSSASFEKFLTGAEDFFNNFDHAFDEDAKSHGELGLITELREARKAEFKRPITLDNFYYEGEFLGNETDNIHLLRIYTHPGHLIYHPKQKSIGVSAFLEEGYEKSIINAVSGFVNKTDSFLPDEVVNRTMELLPYRKKIFLNSD